jgi:hypothetical protein
MNVNIKLTDEQQKAVRTSLIAELTSYELANELFSKVAITGEDTEVTNNLKSALIEYIKENRKVV